MNLNEWEDSKPIPGMEKFALTFINKRIEEIHQLGVITALNHKKLLELTHNWKGFSKPYGFSHLAEISLKIEQAVLLECWNEANLLIATAESYLNHCKIKKVNQFPTLQP